MRKFKFFICAGDLIFIAQGAMSKVRFYSRKPEYCEDNVCDINQLLEVFLHIPNHIKDGKSKGTGKNLDRSSQKRKVVTKELPRLPRNRTTRRKKSHSKKNIS